MLDIDALLAMGKAQADAKIAADVANDPATNAAVPHTPSQVNGNRTHQPQEDNAKQPLVAAPQKTEQEQQQPDIVSPSRRPTDLTDSCYADLPAWLDLTRYHDVQFRNSKLRTYKERKALEEEAARIAERLEDLRRAEENEMQQLRTSTSLPAINKMAPPPLPVTMPTSKSDALRVNGIKRPHSPDYTPSEKFSRRREDGGFKIRGANDSGDTRPGSERRLRLSKSPGLERRISYPEARRRSVEDRGARSRDQSLDRRQGYYRHDDESARYNDRDYDRYEPRDVRGPLPLPSPRDRDWPPSRNGAPRLNYSTPHGLQQQPAQYRGSAALDVRKGGQSFSRPQ